MEFGYCNGHLLVLGAVITLGGCHKLRFNHPAEAAVLRERRRVCSHTSFYNGLLENNKVLLRSELYLHVFSLTPMDKGTEMKLLQVLPLIM